MRCFVVALVVLAVVAGQGDLWAQIPDPTALVRARGLDQQGVRAFRDGRFRDAIRFFEEARRLGGPSSEIWNVARCHQRLDEPDLAARALERYLEQTDLMPSERAEAGRELQELRRRPSQTVVDTDPAGAAVMVDGKPAGSGLTPAGFDVPPGVHRIRVERAGFRPYEVDVEARFGRAILVTTKLVPTNNARSDASGTDVDPSVSVRGRARRFLFSAEAGLFFPKLGAEGSDVRPAGHLAARYVWNPESRVLLTTGLRLSAWSYAGSDPAPLCQLKPNDGSWEMGGLATVGFAVRAAPRIRLGADAGVGVAGLLADASGADAGKPGCSRSYGMTVLGHVGLEASLALNGGVRLVFSPLVFQAHPAFDGSREIPASTIDTSGVWWRLGSALGFAFDAT